MRTGARGLGGGREEGARSSFPGRRVPGLVVLLGLSAGLASLSAQERPPSDHEIPTSVRFRLEEPRPDPFRDRLEIPFVLGQGPEPRWRSPVVGGRRDDPAPPRPAEQPDRATVSIRVFNLLHQRVARAVVAPGEDRSGRPVRDLAFEVPGRYTAAWDGRADDGHRLPSGPYFVELVVDGWTAVRRVLLTR